MKQINNKVLLCSLRNYIQLLELHHNGKECEKEYTLQHCKSNILQ